MIKLKFMIFCIFSVMLLAAVSAKADFSVAGVTFDDFAGVDTLISSSGTYSTSGGSLESVLTDNTANTWAYSFSQGAYVQLGFTDNYLANLAGNDLAVFEIGSPVDDVPVSLTIVGTSVTKTPVYTGFSTGSYNINVAYWDLSTDFGLADGVLLSDVVVIMEDVPGANSAQTIGFVGALNSSVVPVPGAILLGLLGLATAGVKLNKKDE